MSFPCISCGVILATSVQQRQHYKSEWHRYNLKRKVVALPPVTLDEFNIKSALFSKADRKVTSSGDEDVTQKDLPYCQACRKKFSTAKAYDNHVASRKHKQREESAKQNPQQQQQHKSSEWIDVDDSSDGDGGEQQQQEEGDEDEGPSPLGLEECLFCQHVAASLEANCVHMLREHGFVLPDPDLVSDLEGLLTLLDYKVGVGHECLWCHGARRFASLKAVRSHMLDRGHCRYNLAGEHAFDLAEFYDFGGVLEKSRDTNEGEDSESDGDSEAPTDLEAFELVLPSGAVVGHRSLMRYYRQSPAPERAVALSARSPGSAASRLLAQYRAIGWHGELRGQAEVAALRDRAFVQRHRQRAVMHLGVAANRLQKHFRHQNPK